ncbi:MAG: single-stranded-DNA-specific exonuclease RecJ [Oscillospiraceae bacterium]|nr:single-stranded-DNA-specific exonuclease RecJ [Oscillospiraceae bacterium]
MSYTEWKIPYGQSEAAEGLAAAGYAPLLAAVLAARGMDTPEKAERFLRCSPDALGDPFLISDMSLAVERTRRAIAEREHVAVYGDYDVDGITSTCMMSDWLRRRGVECEVYIPGRLDEGYGVNCRAIDTLAALGVTLIITVDCGITAAAETDYAASLGIDMVITDHHECKSALPRAAAVVDPKRADSAYPFRELAGVGVAFKLLSALEGSGEALLRDYADLIALGTVADVMPLEGENRYITSRGMEKLQRDPRPGLRALLKEAGVSGKRLSAISIGYSLAPRINAAGRLGQAEKALRLLLETSPERAAEEAAELCGLNRDRQELETGIWEQAQTMLGDTKPDGPIVLAGEGWHQGIIGIVASRLAEKYGVPTVMITLDGAEGKGSCRSFGGFNLFDALSFCATELDAFGGHALAAGLTLKRERLERFRQKLAEYYAAHPPCGDMSLDIELHIDRPEMLTLSSVESLDRLEPCGTSNPPPTACLTGAVLVSATPLGTGKHTRLKLAKFNHSYECVWFSRSVDALGAVPGDRVDAAFVPQVNEYRSRRSVQLNMIALRRHDPKPLSAVFEGHVPDCGAPAPTRRDLAVVWRSLRSLGGEARGSFAAVAEQLVPGMWDVEVGVCLLILRELQLVYFRFEGSGVTVQARRNPPKVDLNNSKILASMKGGA